MNKDDDQQLLVGKSLLSLLRNSASYRRHQAKIILGIAVSFCLLQFFIQLSSGVMVGAWMQDFDISADLAGVLSAAYFIVYTLLQTPVGVLMDRFGPRKLLSTGAAVCALFCLLFAFTHSFWSAVFARIAIGTSAAFAFVGCLSIIRSWFSSSKYAFLVGVIETVGLLSTILGNLILATYIDTFGWRFFMMLIGSLLLFISFCARLLIKDKPTFSDCYALSEPPSIETDDSDRQMGKNFLSILICILKDPQNWLNGLIYGLMFSLVSVFAGLWAVPFLEKHYAISLTLAAGASSMIFVGAALGGPLLGMLIRSQEQGRQVLIAGSFISAILVAVVIYLPGLPIFFVFPILLLAGFACSAYIFTFSVAKERAPKGGYSTIVGFTNALGVGVAPFLQPIIGWLLHVSSAHHPSLLEPNLLDYEVALSLVPIALVLAGVGAVFLKTRIALTPTSRLIQ